MPARRPAKKHSASGVPIGYARVSTDDQNLALQLDALKKSGCDRVFTDKVSGTRLVRPGLEPWFYGFYLNPHSVEDSTERMLSWGDLEGPRLADFREITYIPLTECAARDVSFQRMLAELMVSIYFDKRKCLLIRLPLPGLELTERLRIALEGIRGAAAHLPQARSKNIFLLADDMPDAALEQIDSRLKVILHQTFEFWRYSRATYANADVTVHLDADWKKVSEAAKKLLAEAFGQPPRFVIARAHDEWDA